MAQSFTSSPDLPDSPSGHGGLLVVLPVVLAAVLIYLRAQAGPFWQWHLLDPAYFDLLDSLNPINWRAAGHIAHPAVTVHFLGAVVIKAFHPLGSAEEITLAVLKNPEFYMTWISNLFIGLLAGATLGVGYVAWRVFGNLLPALVMQGAPFVSTIVLKHAFVPRPESMVAIAAMGLIAVLLIALDPAARRRRPVALPVWFGVVTGFGVATKITSAPVFLVALPLVVGLKGILILGVVSLASFMFFFLPDIGAFDEFLAWVVHVGKGSGAHGAGPQTFINVDQYPKSFIKILKRPTLRMPLILAVLTFAIVWWRMRRGGMDLPAEIRPLAAICGAQLLHAAFVAKHPVAFYMIPSYMLSVVSVFLAVRCLWSLRPARLQRVSGGALGALAFAVFMAAQAATVIRLEHELSNRRHNAASIDNGKFAQCAQIYYYATSSPTYALYLANGVTGEHFNDVLKTLHAPNDYWVDDWLDQVNLKFKNWDGPQNFSAVTAAYPCLYIRGSRPLGLERFLKQEAPGLAVDTSCSAAPETIARVGVDCEGNLTQ